VLRHFESFRERNNIIRLNNNRAIELDVNCKESSGGGRRKEEVKKKNRGWFKQGSNRAIQMRLQAALQAAVARELRTGSVSIIYRKRTR